VPHAAFSGLPVTLSLAGASTDHPFFLGIPQTRVEEVLEARALDLGADIRRGHELRAVEQDSASVTATIADSATGLDTRYDMDQTADHPWLGRLAPNLELLTDAGHTDLATQLTLAAGRPLLLDLAEPRPDRAEPRPDLAEPHPGARAEATAIRQAAADWAGRVSIARAACPAHPHLRAVLVRPDGHTAWLSTADRTHADAGHHTEGLRQALTRWHGSAHGPAGEQHGPSAQTTTACERGA
jgi:hypothetical protein